MATITFDTLKFSRRLQDAGFSQLQAEAFAAAQRDAFAEAMDSSVATKQDIAELETRMVRWMIAIAGVVIAVIKFLPPH